MDTKNITLEFKSDNPNWQITDEYNLLLIRTQISYVNQNLNNGRLMTLNDLHNALGMPRTRDGQIYGWVPGDTLDLDPYIEEGVITMKVDATDILDSF